MSARVGLRDTRLVDDKDREFDPIDDLYKLRGNPECNKSVQPGFEADMSWVYLLPTTATAASWQFRDLTDLGTAPDIWTTVKAAV